MDCNVSIKLGEISSLVSFCLQVGQKQPGQERSEEFNPRQRRSRLAKELGKEDINADL